MVIERVFFHNNVGAPHSPLLRKLSYERRFFTTTSNVTFLHLLSLMADEDTVEGGFRIAHARGGICSAPFCLFGSCTVMGTLPEKGDSVTVTVTKYRKVTVTVSYQF